MVKHKYHEQIMQINCDSMRQCECRITSVLRVVVSHLQTLFTSNYAVTGVSRGDLGHCGDEAITRPRFEGTGRHPRRKAVSCPD